MINVSPENKYLFLNLLYYYRSCNCQKLSWFILERGRSSRKYAEEKELFFEIALVQNGNSIETLFKKIEIKFANVEKKNIKNNEIIKGQKKNNSFLIKKSKFKKKKKC